MIRRTWWAWFLGVALAIGSSACAQRPYYPPLVDPAPRPGPVDPSPTHDPTPTPIPAGALDPALFVPFVRQVTTLDEVKRTVGTGTGSKDGVADDQGVIWFYYLVAIPGYPDAALGFRKGPTGTWTLFEKYVGF